jgi:hypothetical protein
MSSVACSLLNFFARDLCFALGACRYITPLLSGAGRTEETAALIPSPFKWSPPQLRIIYLPDAKGAPALRCSGTRTVPSGISLNWSAPPSISWTSGGLGSLKGGLSEATLAASGRKAGDILSAWSQSFTSLRSQMQVAVVKFRLAVFIPVLSAGRNSPQQHLTFSSNATVGAAKKGPGWKSPKTESTLSTASLTRCFCSLDESRGHTSKDSEECKHMKVSGVYKQAWDLVQDRSPFLGQWYQSRQPSSQLSTAVLGTAQALAC